MSLAAIAFVFALFAAPAFATSTIYVPSKASSKNVHTFGSPDAPASPLPTDNEIAALYAAGHQKMDQDNAIRNQGVKEQIRQRVLAWQQQNSSDSSAAAVVGTQPTGPAPVLVYDQKKQEKAEKKKTIRIFNFKD